MSGLKVKQVSVKGKRLKFIDMARSFAILLMLEGHFVDDSLMDVFRDHDNAIFSTWYYIRGFTAPVFLTVTGLIFTYLLLQKQDEPYFSNLRVKKGFKRVVELFFWGYMLQWYSFHVLECIAAGIFSILVLFLLYKLIKVIPLWIYFMIAGMTLFTSFLYFQNMPDDQQWLPINNSFLESFFHGPKHRSIFPIVPWMGYTMFGSMIGALLHSLHKIVTKYYFAGVFVIVGFILYHYSHELLEVTDSIWASISGRNPKIVRVNWLYNRLGMVFMELGVLMFIDKLLGKRIKDTSLFLKVGQNTLTIYIIHMIVLYGSILGFGLNKYCHKNLNPLQVTVGAILFITTFVIFIKYLDQIKSKLSFILVPISKFFNRLFRVN
jgi:uncharacterized membrane protein